MSDAPDTLLAAAMLRLSMDRPYLSAALWALRRIATEAVPTMAVDAHWRLYYNPKTVVTWSADEVAGVLYHEICHLIREHAVRAPGEVGADPQAAHLWNLAGDAEINDDLKSEGISLPGSPIFPETLGAKPGRTAEEYYRLLAELRDKRGGESEENMPGCGRCGSCAGGRGASWEVTGPDGMPLTEQALVRRSVALAVRDHATRSRGTVPGHWQRWADAHLAPSRVDWRKELAAAVRRAVGEVAGASDYRYRRPSRRQGGIGTSVILPSLVQPTPSVAVVVDTSGSVSSDQLNQAVAEVSGILKAAGQREGVTVLAVDAAVHTCRKVFDARQVRASLAGGGGTDMRVGLEAAARLKPRPEVAVVITDGYTPWPAMPPTGLGRTVVVLTDARGASPDWARTVIIEE